MELQLSTEEGRREVFALVASYLPTYSFLRFRDINTLEVTLDRSNYSQDDLIRHVSKSRGLKHCSILQFVSWYETSGLDELLSAKSVEINYKEIHTSEEVTEISIKNLLRAIYIFLNTKRDTVNLEWEENKLYVSID